MPDDPIRAGQGLYSASGGKKNIGVCLAFDDNISWDIKEAKDGSFVIFIPPDSKWKVTTEQLPDSKRKVVIFREGAKVRREGAFVESDEIQIVYDHPEV